MNFNRFLVLTGTVMVTVLALTGCTGAPQGPSSTNAAACVVDPQAAATASLPARATRPLDKKTASVLDAAALAGFHRAAAPGAIVAVQTPSGTWTKAYGVGDLDHTAMRTDDYFRIGSVTKTFTGTLILQLAQKGKLSLSDTIDKYVAGVPMGKKITLKMLLNMTSGISSYTIDATWIDKYLQNPRQVFTPEQLVDEGLALPRQFAPGAQFNYSNTNAVLLGQVVEKVTGTSYTAALKSQILSPLGLKHTSMPSTAAIPVPHTQGFTLQGTPADKSARPVNATDWSPTFGSYAGQMISTTSDLLAYGRALGTGQGLLDEAQQVSRLASIPAKTGYGLGAGCIDGWFGHTGEIPGYNTTVYYDTTHDTTVVVMANSDIASGACTTSQTMQDNLASSSGSCMSPAVRIFAFVSDALGHKFTPNPMS